uniref:Olfactory receptor n=1 Tax=Capra hircus TaxID=9925 RepID=A0A8C2R7L0_CAPHI
RSWISPPFPRPEFVLQGFSELPRLRLPLFGCFFLYIVALTGSAAIIAVVSRSASLRSPMCFFLCNLAATDIVRTSSALPKALAGLASAENTISFPGCTAQLFFLTWSASSELLLLTVMAYDRYTAICRPLHSSSTAMSKAFCGTLAAGVWALCAFNTAVRAGLMLRLDFCGPDVITHFFCEVPPLLLLSCSSTYVNSIMIVLADAFYGILNFLMTIVSYGFIISSILKMRTAEGKKKAFSICSSHLIVVVLCAGISPASSCSPERSKGSAALYTMLSPTRNPISYSLRNMEVKRALGRLVQALLHPGVRGLPP